MHFIMILTVLALAVGMRCLSTVSAALVTLSWQERWQRALLAFLGPSLLVISTALALLCMGAQGEMFGLPTGWFSYLLASGFLLGGIATGIHQLVEGCQALQKIAAYPSTSLSCQTGQVDAQVMDTQTMFAAQVGFWRSQLVVSQGLLAALDREHLEAVLLHEQAHNYYRDTFYFFWLGWIRQITAWLPNTEALWQELMLLRELRADRWAAQHVDTLLLAESLLWVVSSNAGASEIFAAAFSRMTTRDRLSERIEAILSASQSSEAASDRTTSMIWLCLSLLPLLSVPFHS